MPTMDVPRNSVCGAHGLYLELFRAGLNLDVRTIEIEVPSHPHRATQRAYCLDVIRFEPGRRPSMKSSRPHGRFEASDNPAHRAGSGAGPHYQDKLYQGAADILERMEEGFMLVDADWRILYVNAAGERMSGVSRDRLIGRNHWEAYPAARGTVVEQQYRHAMIHRLTIRFEHYYAPYGRWFASGASPVGESALLLHAIDITERKRAEENACIGDLPGRMNIDNGEEGFYAVRPVFDSGGIAVDFEINDCNRRGAEFFGRRRTDMIGQKISALYAGASVRRSIKTLQEAMEHGLYEDDIEVLPGSPLRMQWARCRIVHSDGMLAVTLRDISAIKAHVRELERRGNEDALTGLPNRYWAQCYLPQAIERAAKSGAELAVLFIDLDGFKAVNDTFGHAAGDELLRIAARRLMLAVRPRDKVVRYGGDEFVIILESLADRHDAEQVAARVLQAFRMNFMLPQGICSIGTSIGVSFFPADGGDADTLLRNADTAMYAAKTAGKNGCRFFDPDFYDGARARSERIAEFRQALELDQFEMRYQPRIDLASGALTGAEALVRWRHPDRGLVAPHAFLPLAEETGDILRLGELIIDKVCAQLSCWRREGCGPFPVSINVSPQQFGQTDLAGIFSASCATHDIEPRMIGIELNERAMMGESRRIPHALEDLHRMGMTILVDDFGAGYASLPQLQRLKVDVLKVGRIFTAEIHRSENAHAIFDAIISMAHALGMRALAEGVENEEQVGILEALGCDEMQGFLISPPLPPEELCRHGGKFKMPFSSGPGAHWWR
jgi:diguanylate cyclase (GGDEF)-like protein/PAS domain S-box-containing protein